jgi:ElaB/YqjD/DUF883 family membrane-anchored ribosome-binding protein
MDRTMTMAGGTSAGETTNPAAKVDVEGATQAAHQTIDKVTERVNAAAHRAVDSTAGAANSAAQWTSGVSEQARRAQTRFTEAACETIRARPFATVASAVVVGYLLGRLARL